MKIPHGVVATTQVKAWMDEVRTLMWIDQVWKPYVSGRRALLALDTFSAHLTDKVRDAFAKCGTELLIIPGGCTSILQPLDVSINKPFKGCIRQEWCQHILAQSESDVPKPQPPFKLQLLEWIKAAQDKIQEKNIVIKKSFLVTGISNALGTDEDKIIRSDVIFDEVQEIMKKVFGDEVLGHVEPSDSSESDSDPFASETSSIESEEAEEAEEAESDGDPFASSDASSSDD